MKKILLFCFMALIFTQAGAQENFPTPQIPFQPKKYICYRASQPIQVDGKIDESDWQKASWSDYFVDIEGHLKPKPRFKTRAKMLWDDQYFYVAAELEEPHVWAKLKQRDTVIFYDNDFEIFIDPDGDAHEYYEYEMNALNTIWDLLLIRPYRDENGAVNAWDIKGIQHGVWVNGTLNDPTDVDKGWQIEVAIPWSVLKECAHKPAPPLPGDQWRVNFSRVEWRVNIENGKYVKKINPKTGRPYPEDNWVWSPQGLIAMHYPEMWGFVQFSDKIAGQGQDNFIWNNDEDVKWALYQIYYAQKQYYIDHGKFASTIEELRLKPHSFKDYNWPPVMETTGNLFEARFVSKNGNSAWCIRQDSKCWKISLK